VITQLPSAAAVPVALSVRLAAVPAAWAPAVAMAAPAGLLGKAPIAASAAETSVDFRIQKPKGDVRTRIQAVPAVGIDARRVHLNKYIPGIPPRGRPV
jgi:hypothetical protein